MNELSCGWANDPVMICRHPDHKEEWGEAVGYDFETETWMDGHTPEIVESAQMEMRL